MLFRFSIGESGELSTRKFCCEAFLISKELSEVVKGAGAGDVCGKAEFLAPLYSLGPLGPMRTICSILLSSLSSVLLFEDSEEATEGSPSTVSLDLQFIGKVVGVVTTVREGKLDHEPILRPE